MTATHARHLAATSLAALLLSPAAWAQGAVAVPGEGAAKAPPLPALEDQEIGKRFHVRASELPAPLPTRRCVTRPRRFP